MVSEHIDTDTLSELKGIMGEEFPILIEAYIDDTKKSLQQLNTLVQEQKWQEVKKILHTLKGSSSNLGIVGLATLCNQFYQKENIEDNILIILQEEFQIVQDMCKNI